MASADKLPLRHKIGAAVAPGDRLGIATRNKISLIAGKGTYIRQGHLYASLLGTLCASSDNNNDEEGEGWVISIHQERSSQNNATNSTIICPQVGMLILGRVTRVARPTHAMVDIVAIVPDDKQEKDDRSKQEPFIIPLHEPFSGTLRSNEIRPNSSLEVRIEECIRPGDLILARIHASGERDFILTTAEGELGVIQAVCESSGCDMRPISWKEMQCTVTLAKEGRKVAKPRQIR